MRLQEFSEGFPARNSELFYLVQAECPSPFCARIMLRTAGRPATQRGNRTFLNNSPEGQSLQMQVVEAERPPNQTTPSQPGMRP